MPVYWVLHLLAAAVVTMALVPTAVVSPWRTVRRSMGALSSMEITNSNYGFDILPALKGEDSRALGY